MRKPFFFSLIAAVIVIIPIIARVLLGQPLLPGTDSYLVASLFEIIGLSRPFSAWFAVILSTIILSISIYISHFAFKKLHLSKGQVDATIVLLILSPAFLAGILIPLHALEMLLISIGVLLIYSKKNKRRYMGISILIITAVLIIWETANQTLGFSIARSIVDLGAARGYGLFAIIAAAVGASVMWKNKARNYFITLGILALVLLSFAVPALILPGSIAVAVVGGLGFARLRTRKWNFQLVRMMSIILFACGILFSTITFMTFEIRSPPNLELVTALSELRFQLPDGFVASAPENEIWINYWSLRPFADLSESEFDALWHSRNLANTSEVIIFNGIESIVITPDMRSIIWTGDDEGLLFILQNSRAFEQITESNVQAWRFKPIELNLTDQ